MSLPRREAAQRLPRREDVYAFVFIIFSRDSRDHSPFYARRRRPFSARGHRPFYARPDKRGSVLLAFLGVLVFLKLLVFLDKLERLDML